MIKNLDMKKLFFVEKYSEKFGFEILKLEKLEPEVQVSMYM